jgi:hypothetical protein
MRPVVGAVNSCTSSSLKRMPTYKYNQHSDVGQSDVGPRATHLLGIVVVSFRGASGNTLYWVLLVYAGPRATHFTGYCCWFDVGLRATHFTGYRCWVSGSTLLLLGIVVGLCASGNTLLGIAVGLCGASGNIPILRATHFTGYCC